MLTKARIAGHPIHPMLVAFPIAFYVSTVVALVVFLATDNPFWRDVAFYANIAGVVMAGAAAIPGLIDLLGLERGTAARSTGIRHAGFNVLALVLFIGSAISLSRETVIGSVTAPLVLGILGLLATVTAGWLGYDMIQKHHVGVQTVDDLETDVTAPDVDLRMRPRYDEVPRAPLH